jgi:small subunit ribosomal protein S16
MVTIRLTRMGSKKRPFFRVVVCEARSARDGAFIENLGYYNPRKAPEVLSIDRERLAHWVDRGARLSDTMRTLVARHKNDPVAVAAVTPDAPAASAEASA